MTTLTAQESAPDLPPGVYPATLTGYEEQPDNGFGPGVKLIWQLDGLEDRDGNPREKWQFTSQKLTPKSKLWGTLTAIGVKVVLGTTYNLDDLMGQAVGRRAQLTVKHVPTPTGESARVTDVNGVVGQASPAPKAAKAESIATCAVEGCASEVAKFTNRGTPLCAEHTAEDL